MAIGGTKGLKTNHCERVWQRMGKGALYGKKKEVRRWRGTDRWEKAWWRTNKSLWKGKKGKPVNGERSVCPTMNLGCWGEIVATYNPNTRVVFLCTHRGTLELSWPLEKEVRPWLPEYSGAQILQESWKWLYDRHQPPSLSGIRGSLRHDTLASLCIQKLSSTWWKVSAIVLNVCQNISIQHQCRGTLSILPRAPRQTQHWSFPFQKFLHSMQTQILKNQTPQAQTSLPGTGRKSLLLHHQKA